MRCEDLSDDTKPRSGFEEGRASFTWRHIVGPDGE